MFTSVFGIPNEKMLTKLYALEQALSYLRSGLPSGPKGEKVGSFSSTYFPRMLVCRCIPSSERHENDIEDNGSLSVISGRPTMSAKLVSASCIRSSIEVLGDGNTGRIRATRSSKNLEYTRLRIDAEPGLRDKLEEPP